LFQYYILVPDKEMVSCMDPELPGTGLRTEGMRDPARPTMGKRVCGTQQRWGKHEKKRKRTYSGHDGGGSAANRMRRLLLLNWIASKK
jgi:hypothetical protein